LENYLGYGNYYFGEEKEKNFRNWIETLYWNCLAGISFLQVTWKILGCPIYRENSVEISVGFGNLEIFLSWNGNIT